MTAPLSLIKDHPKAAIAAGAGAFLLVCIILKVKQAQAGGCSGCEKRKQWLQAQGLWPQEVTTNG